MFTHTQWCVPFYALSISKGEIKGKGEKRYKDMTGEGENRLGIEGEEYTT
jgi:hypothetical protein